MEDVAKVVLLEQFSVLLVSNTEAVKKIIDVGWGEIWTILETSQVRVEVVVILDCLNNVSLALKFKEFLCNKNVTIVKGHIEVS